MVRTGSPTCTSRPQKERDRGRAVKRGGGSIEDGEVVDDFQRGVGNKLNSVGVLLLHVNDSSAEFGPHGFFVHAR